MRNVPTPAQENKGKIAQTPGTSRSVENLGKAQAHTPGTSHSIKYSPSLDSNNLFGDVTGFKTEESFQAENSTAILEDDIPTHQSTPINSPENITVPLTDKQKDLMNITMFSLKSKTPSDSTESTNPSQIGQPQISNPTIQDPQSPINPPENSLDPLRDEIMQELEEMRMNLPREMQSIFDQNVPQIEAFLQTQLGELVQILKEQITRTFNDLLHGLIQNQGKTEENFNKLNQTIQTIPDLVASKITDHLREVKNIQTIQNQGLRQVTLATRHLQQRMDTEVTNNQASLAQVLAVLMELTQQFQEIREFIQNNYSQTPPSENSDPEIQSHPSSPNNPPPQDEIQEPPASNQIEETQTEENQTSKTSFSIPFPFDDLGFLRKKSPMLTKAKSVPNVNAETTTHQSTILSGNLNPSPLNLSIDSHTGFTPPVSSSPHISRQPSNATEIYNDSQEVANPQAPQVPSQEPTLPPNPPTYQETVRKSSPPMPRYQIRITKPSDGKSVLSLFPVTNLLDNLIDFGLPEDQQVPPPRNQNQSNNQSNNQSITDNPVLTQLLQSIAEDKHRERDQKDEEIENKRRELAIREQEIATERLRLEQTFALKQAKEQRKAQEQAQYRQERNQMNASMNAGNAFANTRGTTATLDMNDLPTFNGNPPEQIIDFFAGLEKFAVKMHWEEEAVLSQLQTLLSHTALAVFNGLYHPGITYQEIKTQLLNHYITADFKHDKFTDLKLCKQKPNQNINEYYNEFIELAQVILHNYNPNAPPPDPTNPPLASHTPMVFAEGLSHPAIKFHVKRQDPRSVDEAFHFAIREARVLEIDQTPGQNGFNSTQSAPPAKTRAYYPKPTQTPMAPTTSRLPPTFSKFGLPCTCHGGSPTISKLSPKSLQSPNGNTKLLSPPTTILPGPKSLSSAGPILSTPHPKFLSPSL